MSPLVKNLAAAALAATLSTATQAAPSPSYVIDPSQPVAGQSQLDLSQQWWQWVLSVPAAITPQLDDTGARASINNDGSVFFLAGNWGGPSTRTINLPVGLPLFFPVLNQAYIFTPATDPTDMRDCSNHPVSEWVTCGLAVTSRSLDNTNDMNATLDGQPLTWVREISTALFDVAVPDGNVLGADPGTYAAVSDGYWVALAPLARGQHVLEFGGTMPYGDAAFTVQVIDRLNVPEPPTPMIALSALAALALVRRRRAQV